MKKRKRNKEIQEVSRRDFRKNYLHAMQVLEEFPLINPVDVYEGLDRHDYFNRNLRIAGEKVIHNERLHKDDIGFFQRFDLEEMTKHFRISPDYYDPETAVDGVAHIREYFKSQWGRKEASATNFLLADFYSYFIHAKEKLSKLFNNVEEESTSTAFLEMNGIILPLDYRKQGALPVESVHNILNAIIGDIEESSQLIKKGEMGLVNTRTNSYSALEGMAVAHTEDYVPTKQAIRIVHPYLNVNELKKLKDTGQVQTKRRKGKTIYYNLSDLKFYADQKRIQEEDVNKKVIIKALQKSIPPQKLRQWKIQQRVDYDDLMNLSAFKDASEEAILDIAEKLEVLGIYIKDVKPADEHKKTLTNYLNERMHSDNITYYIQTVLPNKLFSDKEEEDILKKHTAYRRDFLRLALRNPSIAHKMAKKMQSSIYQIPFVSTKSFFTGDDEQKSKYILEWKKLLTKFNKNLKLAKGLEATLLSATGEHREKAIEQYKAIQDSNEAAVLESGANEWALTRFTKDYLNESIPVPELDRSKDIREAYKKYDEVRKSIAINLARLGFSIAKKRSYALHLSQQQLKTFSKPELLLELVQEANIGILKSIDRFDLEESRKMNVKKISTYSTYWMKLATGRKVNELRELKPHQAQEFSKMQRTITEFKQLRHRSPSIFELADLMKMSPKKIVNIKNYTKNIISLDKEVGTEGDSTLKEFIESKPRQQKKSFQMEKRGFMNQVEKILDEKEWYIIHSRFVKGMTLEEVGDTLDVTRERIRQIESSAIEKLQTPRNLSSLGQFVKFDKKSKSFDN